MPCWWRWQRYMDGITTLWMRSPDSSSQSPRTACPIGCYAVSVPKSRQPCSQSKSSHLQPEHCLLSLYCRVLDDVSAQQIQNCCLPKVENTAQLSRNSDSVHSVSEKTE